MAQVEHRRMSGNQVIRWVASAVVGAAAVYLVEELFSPASAIVVGPIATFAAHRLFDAQVARTLQRAMR